MPRLFCLVLALGVACLPAFGGVIAVSGSVALIPAPGSVGMNVGIESDTTAFLFLERTHFALSNSLTFNIGEPGFYNDVALFTPGTLVAGTVVDSYYLHVDAVGQLHNFAFSGSVTFSAPVLGIITADPAFLGSQILGAGTTSYSPGFGRFEFYEDTVTLSADRHTVSLTTITNVGADDLRIITVAAPEPSTVLLFATGMVLVYFGHRRSKQDPLEERSSAWATPSQHTNAGSPRDARRA